jgi:IS1 family transposase
LCCDVCDTTFSTNTGTPYHRLHGSRRAFDTVVKLSVEGLSKSAIARVTGLSWNTVARWLERAAEAARSFNDRKLKGFELIELQVDEICTFVGSKRDLSWIFNAIEVSSRLWSSSVIGRRSYRNTEKLTNDVLQRSWFRKLPLMTSDGFKYYGRVLWSLLGHACVHGQVIKKRRNDRVTRVERKLVIGSKERLEEALLRSEDSETLNTSFIERLNLSIRQACAYLSRRTLAHARASHPLTDQVELTRCWYNFIRPHRALRFGKAMRTPAMQAGLVSRARRYRACLSRGRRSSGGQHDVSSSSWRPDQQ